MDNKTEYYLLKFAVETLRTLQHHEEWTPDTIDQIASLAHYKGLAECGFDGRFRVTPEVEKILADKARNLWAK